jgi:hypothetical protein
VISLSKSQLTQVEYLIDQSMKGNHILFDIESLRKVFQKEKNQASAVLTDEKAYEVEHHIENLIHKPTMEHKKAYLDALDSQTFELVVKTYFYIVENNIFETTEVTH